MRSALYAANTSSQAVADGGNINYGQVVRRFGCNIKMDGPNPVIQGTGYYRIASNITINPSANGIATLTLYKNGVVVPGAKAQVITAAGSPYSLSVDAIVRDTCDCQSDITATISGVAGNVTNAAIAIEKI